ncbi:Lrp/AsnC family transcriptional regulator [Thalassobius vesicularis]|uniref:siroheme decarboxylase n=1 Tax=Thalassobius vesicularis TaxID=1294297 RepID=A0A4S3M784_9RHOB|nr:Lrp/AsnC family transcriptional regulator [Thalassobius vesicularis]THD73041.1 Lrp/AsnC family transcriptional regulator [Thalassobius vesicularis]
MISRLHQLDRTLLNDFQRDFPLVNRPFAQIAETVGATEDEVLCHLTRLQNEGRIARVGGTVRPNTAGASTLAAMAVPDEALHDVAQRVSQEPGVNHSYLRENDWNLWFVNTAPNEALLEASLDAIRRDTGLQVLDLRLVRPFNIDLGFSLSGDKRSLPPQRDPDLSVLQEQDRGLLHALSQGMPICQTPFAKLAQTLGMAENAVIDRIQTLFDAAILTRIGVIVRHRSVGWSSNAMVVWNVPQDRMIAAGTALAAHPGVTLCYQRRTVPGVWDYGLYSMIHARSRSEADATLRSAAALPELAGIDHLPLYSLHCYKQTGAVLDQPIRKAG